MKKVMIRTMASLITVFFILTVIFGISNYAFFEKQVSEQLATYGIVGLFFLPIFLEFIPTYVSAHIGIVNAALYNINPFSTILALLSGSILGSLLGFEVGRIYGYEFVKELIGIKRFEKMEKGVNRRGKWIVLLAAISPIPYVPMILGAIRMNRKKFILWGIFPRSIGYVIATIFVYFIL